MSARIDPNASRYATEHVPGRTCVPCFSTFMISPDLFDIDKTTGVDKKTGIVPGEDQVAYEIAALVGSHPADSSWWKAYIFALSDSRAHISDLRSRHRGAGDSVRRKRLVAGLKMAKKWDDWMDSLNGRYSMAGNYLMAIIATTTIGMITTIVLGFMHVVGWGLGTLESILIVVSLASPSTTPSTSRTPT
ncbi:hypothetical protein JL720_14439 [Aureococcus anophagefferens]|nr:hypothetical protein JL720_14439 [Aureococcus anophagefferens]